MGMHIIEKEVLCDYIEDVTCDSCGISTWKEPNFEYANFRASWGYESKLDDVRWDFFLCEDCAIKIYDEYIKGKEYD